MYLYSFILIFASRFYRLFSSVKGIITTINYNSVKCFIKIQNLFTICKVTACIFVIVGGVYQLYSGNYEILLKKKIQLPYHFTYFINIAIRSDAAGNTKNLMTGFDGTTLSMDSFPIAFYSGLWAYDGW